MAIQPDGKIVAAGESSSSLSNSDFAVTRYNSNGSRDTTFSGDGRLITNFGGGDRAYDIAIQSDGKIIASGERISNTSMIPNVALARYNTNGALDTTFSGDGKVLTNYGGKGSGSEGGLAILSDGRIVVAGYVWNGTNTDFAVYSYNPNGSLDTTFSANGDGVSISEFGSGRQDLAGDLAIQSDGKIVVVGFSGDANGNNNNFAILRLHKNGTGDFTFSGDARQTTNFGADEYAYGLALGPNGKIVVVGEKRTSTTSYFAIARYNENGTIDTTFNGTGKKVLSIIPGEWSLANDVIVQPNGKIVVVGFTRNGSGTYDFAVLRLNGNGSFDTTFSGDGRVIVDFGGLDFGFALVRQPSEGKYVLGGYTRDGTQDDFGLARLLP
jgi:uncharacterized delta-60 repeat protein